jgi:hypothetical protein
MAIGRFSTRALLIAAGMAAGPVLAQDASLICRNAGNEYKVGEYACIAACHGQRRLARCDAIATAATWTYVSDACPSAMIVPEWPSDWSELPAIAAMTPIPVDVNMSAIAPAIAQKIAKPKLKQLSALAQ